MFKHITMVQARKLVNAPYHYMGGMVQTGISSRDVKEIQLKDIADWSDKVDMKILYIPCFLYFENLEDRLNFRLRWC